MKTIFEVFENTIKELEEKAEVYKKLDDAPILERLYYPQALMFAAELLRNNSHIQDLIDGNTTVEYSSNRSVSKPYRDRVESRRGKERPMGYSEL